MATGRGRSVPVPLLAGLCVLAGSLGSAWPACTTTVGYFASYSYVVSPGLNTPQSIESLFWALGHGDPSSPGGADNGSWEDTDVVGGGIPGWLLHGTGGNYLQGTWFSSPEIDGCFEGRIAPGKSKEIMVAAFTDEDTLPRGYFAVAAVQLTGSGIFFHFTFPTDIDLIPIPYPRILGSRRVGPHEVELDVRGPSLAELSPAVFTDGSATAAELLSGFRIYEHPRVPGGVDPKRSDPGWVPVAASAPLGQSVTFTLACGCDSASLLAIALVFDSGFESRHLSLPIQVSCSPPICEYEPWPDADGDGYTLDPCCGLGLDCDDSNAEVHPGAAEVCNALDDDCDGSVDEDANGEDSDGDGVQNLCDRCALVYDPSQHDLDGDGQGDACDLDDALILLGFEAPERVAWQPEAGYASWNLYRGDLDVLAATGVYTQAPGSNALARRDCGLFDAYDADPSRPELRKTAFFLVTGNAASGEGSLGSDSRGALRPNAHPCP